jgi:tetratricopeptide (TPR) repeat protein
MTFLPRAGAATSIAAGAAMSRPLHLQRLLLVGLGLGFASWALAEDDLRSQRATRRVLKARAEQEEQSEAARALAAARRREAMDLLGPLIQQAEGERRARMILRLAELSAAEADELRLRALSGVDGRAPRCGLPALPSCDSLPEAREAREWRQKAERLYAQVVLAYPQLDGADDAAWGQALALLDLERPDEALRVLTWLVRNHPDSPHVPSAYVLIGDHHFGRDRALPALAAYQRGAAFEQAEIRPYARYKLAWCLYNLGEYGQAIDVMRAVALEGGEGTLGLQEEAQRDLARFFADAGDWHGALRFYEGLGRPDLLRSAMAQVAASLRETGRPELAVRVLELLLVEQPRAVEAPAWQAEVVAIHHRQGRGDAAVEALGRLVLDYGPQGAWARTHAADPDALAEAERRLESTLRGLAVDWHQQARKLRQGAGAEAAAGWALAAYTAWLERFEARPEAHELRYAYAELLYQLQRHDEAWQQYGEVVRRDPSGPRSLFCAESAVYVAEERSATLRRGAKAPLGTEPSPLDVWSARLVESVDRYLELQPEGDRSLAFATKAAWLLYHHNHFAEAAARFRLVIAMEPGSEEAEIAANLILDALNLVGDYAALAESAESFLQHEGLGRAGFHRQLELIHERARFRVVERALELDGDRGGAALAFEAYAERFPGSELAPLALHNAAVHYRSAADPHGAIRAARALVERHPDAEYVGEALAGLGFDCESLADFEAAAGWYERLAGAVPDHGSAADALWSAALFRQSMGDDRRALEDLSLHARRYPEHPRQGELLARVAEIHEEAGRHGDAAGAWGAIADLEPEQASTVQRAEAAVRLGRALRADGRDAAARMAWQRAVERWAEEAAARPELRPEVAEALFLLGEERVAHYEAVELSLGAPSGRAAAEAWARRQVRAKAQALAELERANAAVIQVGDGGWGLAALVRLGGAYEHMAACLRGAWVPPWLTTEQAELYRLRLEDEAWLQEEKAVGAYRRAVERSRELAVYGEAVGEASRRLGTLRPEEHPEAWEDLLAPRFIGGGPTPPAFAREP